MKKIIFVDLPGSKSLPDSPTLKTAADGCKMISVTSPEAASTALMNQKTIDIMVCNAANPEILKICREKHPDAVIILMTDQTMDKYSGDVAGKEEELIDHVIANRYPAPWTVREFNVTIQKLIREDYFGLEKYLLPGTKVVEHAVTGSECREMINGKVQAFASESKLNGYIAKMAFGISEELLMNAIYDAPAAAGSKEHMESDRINAIHLKEHEQGKLSYGCDGNIFGISVTDPFGKLERTIFRKYLKKVMVRKDSSKLIDTKKGGAGLGLFKILFGAHALICNVEKDKLTEVIALIDVTEQIRDFSRMARSLHFFEKS